MTNTPDQLQAAAVLAAARAARRAENKAATDLLVRAVEWARLNEVASVEDAATWGGGSGW